MSIEIRSGVRFPVLNRIHNYFIKRKGKIKITVPKIVLCLVTATSFGLSVYSTVGNNWSENMGVDVTYGLWRKCYGENAEICYALPDKNNPPWLVVCKAATVICCCLNLIGIFTSVATLLNHAVKGYVTSAVMTFAAIFVGSAVVVYKLKLKWEIENLECGLHYFCAWLSTVFSAFSAFLGWCTF